MTHEPVVHGDPIRFTDGSGIRVESADGLVQLVSVDAGGAPVSGVELAPTEAQQLGQALLAAAFHTNSTAKAGSSRAVKNRHMTTPDAVARVIREERTSRGWTQAELASRAGVECEFIAQLEQTHDTAELAEILHVLDALDVHATALPSNRRDYSLHTVDLDAIVQGHL